MANLNIYDKVFLFGTIIWIILEVWIFSNKYK